MTAEGAAYEAHMTKADGSRLPLKWIASFKVTSTESGPMGPLVFSQLDRCLSPRSNSGTLA